MPKAILVPMFSIPFPFNSFQSTRKWEMLFQSYPMHLPMQSSRGGNSRCILRLS